MTGCCMSQFLFFFFFCLLFLGVYLFPSRSVCSLEYLICLFIACFFRLCSVKCLQRTRRWKTTFCGFSQKVSEQKTHKQINRAQQQPPKRRKKTNTRPRK